MTWCYVPETDCHSAQEPEGLIWASYLQNQPSTRDALSNGSHTPESASLQRSGQDTLPLPRSGPTSALLMRALIAGQLIPSSLAILASRSVQQESGKAQTTIATCGPKSPASSAKCSPDGYSLRMSPGTSASALKPCCESYGIWAGRLRLAYSQRRKLARRMSGFAGSAWPTATVSTGAQTAENPTPAQTGGTSLPGAAEVWQTPQAQDRDGFQTPNSQIGLKKQIKGYLKNGRLVKRPWSTVEEHLFSRQAQATTQHGSTLSQFVQIWRLLRASVIARHSQATWRRMLRSKSKRRLNPLFVEWLMGWPAGHAVCAPSETEWCRWQQRMRGALSALPTACGPWIWKPPAEEQKAPTQRSLFE